MNTRKLISLGCVVSILGLGLALSSCSSIDTRKNEHQAAFTSLTQEQRSLVSKGRITTGMSQDAVRIALGNPQKMVNKKGVECWQYAREEVDTMKTLPAHQSAPTYLSYIGNDREYNETEQFWVFFKEGKVVSWK